MERVLSSHDGQVLLTGSRRALASSAHSSDEENDPEGLWFPTLDPDRSVRSDEGYASHRRRCYKLGQSLPTHQQLDTREDGESDTSSGSHHAVSEGLVKSNSSLSLKISSDDETEQPWLGSNSASHLLVSRIDNFSPMSNTNLTKTDRQTECETDSLSRTAHSDHGVPDFDQFTPEQAKRSRRITDTQQDTPVFHTASVEDGDVLKSCSSPELYENFFSKTPLSVAGHARAWVHRPGSATPGGAVPSPLASSSSLRSNKSSNQRADRRPLVDQTGRDSSSLPLALNLSSKPLYYLLHRHHSDQDKVQNQQREPLLQNHHHQPQQTSLYPVIRPNQYQQVEEDQARQTQSYLDQLLDQRTHQLGHKQEVSPVTKLAAHPTPFPPHSPRISRGLSDGSGAGYRRQGARDLSRLRPPPDPAEDTSQFSSVSSFSSLTDNINTHARHDDRAMDFGHLKSAMKQSSQREGQGPRRRSLFNSVLRRVSIHRRDSTPASRIATFLFGVDDRKNKHNKAASDTESKEMSGDSLLEVQRAKRAANLRESLFQILSGLYGIMIVILGAVIPITEIFMSEEIDSTFEGFYIYLYSVSILFLVYVYAYLLRRNRLKTELLTRTLSRSLSSSRAWAKGLARPDTDTKSKFRKRMISLDVSNHHTGTFYLRLGVLGFGIGSMIHSGLNFGSFVSVSGGDCSEPVQWVKPLIHLMFTFFQLYFIFMNSKMCIHRYKKLARFGLVHMCSTNICVWFRSIVVETLHVIHHSDTRGHHGAESGHHPASDNSTHASSYPHSAVGHGISHHGSPGPEYVIHDEGMEKTLVDNMSHVHHISRKLLAASVNASGNISSASKDNCHWKNMMSQAVEEAGPYLYPCTIEYSLMCAGILYIMWTNVGKRPRRPTRSELETDSEDDGVEDEQRAQRMSVDCTSSSRGLFLGILLMVGTIISIIAFYMLVNQEEMQDSAIFLTHMSGTFIYTVTLLALLLAAARMKNLSFHNQQEANLEDILILISYTGLLVFIIFSLIASILAETSTMSTLTILSNVSMLLQATVQTIFMLAGDRMFAATEKQVRKKPGREFITFLLISNFAMWAINTFQTQTPQHNPIQVDFYGPEAWAIFTHISVPLGIYYRFHSTVCFSNIWKNAWKKRKHA